MRQRVSRATVPLKARIRWKHADVLEKVLAYEPDIVCATLMTRNVLGFRALLPLIKKHSNAFTAIGGYYGVGGNQWLAAAVVRQCTASAEQNDGLAGGREASGPAVGVDRVEADGAFADHAPAPP